MQQSAIITGASTGIGRATAIYLDERGFRVFAGVRKPEDIVRLAKSGSDRLTPLTIDVTDAASIEAAARSVEEAVGEAGLGGVVNNAGIGVGGVQEFLDLDELRRQLEVNVVGPVAVTRAFLPLLRKARGRIVNISSNGGYIAAPFLGPYAASKFALEALSDSLRRELRPWGIHVAVIEPGSIQSDIWEKARDQTRELHEGLSEPARALYGPALDAMSRYVEQTAGRAIPPEAVAREVHHALTAGKPRTRYRVGVDAKATRLLSYLPDRAIDALLARGIGYGGSG